MVLTIIINMKNNKYRYNDSLKELQKIGLDNVIIFNAIDGNLDLNNYEYTAMENFVNPCTNAQLRVGEIGCSLSHYFVWKFICENQISEALILEDDNVFLSDFNKELNLILNSNLNYDLFFFNRNKVNKNINETIVNNKYVKMSYSYNANAYLIKNKAAFVLYSSNFIDNIMPVDEFLPIMYDKMYPHKFLKNKINPSQYLDSYSLLRHVCKQRNGSSQANHSEFYNSYANV
jgi:collagen beta-1,O-galactosyltransferase